MRSPLATLQGLHSALPATWKAATGEHYPAIKILCLDAAPRIASVIACPRNCGCDHELIMRHDKTAVIAGCRCQPPTCPDFEVSVEEATPLRLNRARLGRAVCRALGCSSKPIDLSLANTSQIAAWSAEAVPIILTTEGAPGPFRRIITELVARLYARFILIAPTADLLDANCQEHLARVKAGFFTFETIFTLTPSGTLQPVKTPGELFMNFNPQPKDIDLSAAQQAFALVRALNTQNPDAKPTIISVFTAYCMEGRNISQTAVDCKCSRRTVTRRLNLIHRQTGLHPDYLRTLSTHLAEIADSLSDPRARNQNPTIDPDALD